MFTYDDGLLAEKLWEELIKAKKDNILLSCELHVAKDAVAELQDKNESLSHALSEIMSEKEQEDAEGD